MKKNVGHSTLLASTTELADVLGLEKSKPDPAQVLLYSNAPNNVLSKHSGRVESSSTKYREAVKKLHRSTPININKDLENIIILTDNQHTHLK